MTRLNFKSNKLSLNTFDFILNSIQNLYANCELTKCLFDNNDSKRCNVKFSSCSFEILDELIHSKNRQDDPFVRFFLNSVKSFHNTQTCSTKTLICFTVFLWRQIKFIFLQQNETSNTIDSTSLSPRLFSKYLNTVLEEIINTYVKNNSELIHKLEIRNEKISLQENIYVYRNLINGVCRSQSIFSQMALEIITKYGKINQDLSTFNSEKVSIVTSSPFYSLSNASEHQENYLKSSNTEFEFTVEVGLHFLLNELNYSHITSLGNQNKYVKHILII
jgi:hypothetical protein